MNVPFADFLLWLAFLLCLLDFFLALPTLPCFLALPILACFLALLTRLAYLITFLLTFPLFALLSTALSLAP